MFQTYLKLCYNDDRMTERKVYIMGFRIYHGQTPLTVSITDGDRMAIAYNVLYALADHGAIYNGKTMEKEKLTVMDDAGKIFMPELDPEWNGTLSQRLQARGQQIDRIVEEARKMGIETDREIEAAAMNPYSVSLDSGKTDYIDFGIETNDFDKALEALGFLQHGIDPSVSISVSYADNDRIEALSGMDGDYINYLPLSAGKLVLMDSYEVIERTDSDPAWAEGKMGDDSSIAIDDNFADIVAGISASIQAMHQ